MDITSAFLCGTFLRREIFIELPSADRESGRAKVGVLRKTLYRTRDSPLIWANEVRSTLEGGGAPAESSCNHQSVFTALKNCL